MAKLLRNIDSKTKSNYFDGSDESRNRDCTDGDFSGIIQFGIENDLTPGAEDYFHCSKPVNFPTRKFYEGKLEEEGTLCRNWGQGRKCVNPCDLNPTSETENAGWFYDNTFCNTLEIQNLVADCNCNDIGPDDPRAWFCPNCADSGEFKECSTDDDCYPIPEHCAVSYLGAISGTERTIYEENNTLYYECEEDEPTGNLFRYDCVEGLYGCTDTIACNHDPCANIQVEGYCQERNSGYIYTINQIPNEYECCGDNIIGYCLEISTNTVTDDESFVQCCGDDGTDCGNDGPNTWIEVGEDCGPNGYNDWITHTGCFYVGMTADEVENYWYDGTFYSTTDYGLPCNCDPTYYFLCADDTEFEGDLHCSEVSLAECGGVWDSCDYRASRQFGELEKELEFVNPSECDWSLGDEMPQWYCRFMASIGYGFWNMFDNQPMFDNYFLEENQREYLDGLSDCVIGAEKIRLDDGSFDSNGETFTCGCNGVSISSPDSEEYGWINQEHENEYLTCNMCVRKPGGTTAYDDVYGKCFNGNPPSFAAEKIRILQDDAFIPQYGYCCDETAVNFSGGLACGVVPLPETQDMELGQPTEAPSWIPLPNLPDEKNIPAYYEFNNDGVREILQRYHVDEGRGTENTCPSNGESVPHQSSANPIGIKQCSCFCKYADSMGNVCYPYEMVMHADGVEVCDVNLSEHQNRLGESRHILNDDLDNHYTIGRHYFPNFATAGYNYGSELPEITECDITLDMEECEASPCTDNGPIIQQAIDNFETVLPDDSDGFYTICMPSGDYAIYTNIKLNKSNVVLKGLGDTRLYFGEIAEDIPGDFGEDLNLDKFNKVTECLFNTMAMQRADVNLALDSLLSYTGECSDYYEGFFSGLTDLGSRISDEYQSMCCEDGYGGDTNCDDKESNDFNPGNAWRNSCKRYWARNNHNGFDAGEDVNAGYELWNCDSQADDCEIFDDLLIDTGYPTWYSECAQSEMSCNTNLCDTIIGKAVYFGCFVTSEPDDILDGYDYTDDQERFEPGFFNMFNDFLDRCPDYSISFVTHQESWDDWDEAQCANYCVFSTSEYQGNEVCVGNYPYQWHIDPTSNEQWPNNMCKWWESNMSIGDSGPYPCGIEQNTTANRFGFYEDDENSLTVEEMYSEFFIAGYCEPPEEPEGGFQPGVGYSGGTCKVYCDQFEDGCGNDATKSDIVNQRQIDDKEYYDNVAKFEELGEYKPMTEKPCDYWTSGYGDFQCGYEKTPQDFCQGSCGRKTAKIQIGSTFGELMDSNKFTLTEPGLKNSNYIYVESGTSSLPGETPAPGSIRSGDKIIIYMVMSKKFREEHNVTAEQTGMSEDFWSSRINGLRDGDSIIMFVRNVVSNPELVGNNIVRLTLDIPLRYKIPIYENVEKPYIKKFTNPRLNNIGLQDIHITNALDYEDAQFWSPGQDIIDVNRVEDSWIKNVNSFAPGTELAKRVHQNEDIDIFGNTHNTNPPNEYLTKLLCAGGTAYDLLDIDYTNTDEVAEWFLDRCSDENFEPAKETFDTIMSNLYTPNPSNVTNESRHLLSNGISVSLAKNFTIKNCTLMNPQNRNRNGNGYLFLIDSGNEILVEDCYGYRGRHNFILGGNLRNSGIVLNRIKSEGGWSFNFIDDDWWSRYQQLEIPGLGVPGLSDTHSPLNMSFLVTDSDINDGFSTKNRQTLSGGAGITGVDGVFWNIKNTAGYMGGGDVSEYPITDRWQTMSVPGMGVLESYQWGTGYLKDISDDVLVLNDYNAPYDYARNLVRNTIAMMTGELVSVTTEESRFIYQLLSPIIGQFTANAIQAIVPDVAQDFLDLIPDTTERKTPVDLSWLGSWLECHYDATLKDFKCPYAHDLSEGDYNVSAGNCDELITGLDINTDYDVEQNQMLIKIHMDRFRTDMSFKICSVYANLCSVVNNDTPCGFDPARLTIRDIDFTIQLDLENGEVVGTPTLTFPNERVDIDVAGWAWDSWDWTGPLVDDGVAAGIKDGIEQPLSDMINVINPVLKEVVKIFEETSALLPLDQMNGALGTGASDKLYEKQIDYVGGNSSLIPDSGRWGDENLYEYQKEYGSVFSSNDYNRSLENDTELDDSESYYPKDGVYQSPSKEHLDWRWYTNLAAFGCPDPMAWPNYDYFATIDDGSCKYYEDFYGTGDLNGSGTAGNPHLTLDDLELMVDYVDCINNVDERTNPEDCIGTLDTELPLEEFIKIGDMNGDNDINIDDIELLSDIIDTQAGDFTDELDRLAHLINWLLDNITIQEQGFDLTACQILGLLTLDTNTEESLFGDFDLFNPMSCLNDGVGVQPNCENLKLFLSDGFTNVLEEDFITIPCEHRIGALIAWASSLVCTDDQNPYCNMEENTCVGGSNEGLCCPYDNIAPYTDGCPDYYHWMNQSEGHTCGDNECGVMGDQPCPNPGNIYWSSACNENYECFYEGWITNDFNGCTDTNENGDLLTGNFEISYYTNLETWLAVRDSFKDSSGNGYCDYFPDRCEKIDNEDDYCNTRLDQTWCFVEEEYCGDPVACNYGADENCTYPDDFSNLCFMDMDGDGDYERGILLNFCPPDSLNNASTCEDQDGDYVSPGNQGFVYGCQDIRACNYNPFATEGDPRLCDYQNRGYYGLGSDITIYGKNCKDVNVLNDFITLNPTYWNGSDRVDLTIREMVNEGFAVFNNRGHLIELKMQQKRLEGSLPESIGHASSLEVIDLHTNGLNWGGNFGGPIPESIGDLKQLRIFDGGGNGWSGEIPQGIFIKSIGDEGGTDDVVPTGASRLEYLDLQGNVLSEGDKLTGNLPQGISNLPNLVNFKVQRNELSGEIPEDIFDIMNVEGFNLGSNFFEGTISDNICNMLANRDDSLGSNQFANSYAINNNNLCPPYPECIEAEGFEVGNQDTSNCSRGGRNIGEIGGLDKTSSKFVNRRITDIHNILKDKKNKNRVKEAKAMLKTFKKDLSKF